MKIISLDRGLDIRILQFSSFEEDSLFPTTKNFRPGIAEKAVFNRVKSNLKSFAKK